MKAPQISVIISTFNAEAWLEKVLWGYNQQQFRDFEVVIADDGSGPDTKALLKRMQEEVFYDLVHVWQEDDGFQKSRILNKAIVACRAPYIVMSDGDCIPRADFLQVHQDEKEAGYFISGGYFMLPMHISKLISKEDIETGRCFEVDWLLENGLKRSFKNNKLTASGWKAKFLNAITPTNASWNGHNSSGWKKDIEAVNGFDERMQYGGQDRELGERLFNYGIKSKQLRYSAVCVHLDHKRGYKTPESIAKNQAIRKHTRDSKSPWTPYGIVKKESRGE
ncbi:glycosyltransferase family 2 protein [Flavobacteriaceae bacterium M23B6Z8]